MKTVTFKQRLIYLLDEGEVDLALSILRKWSKMVNADFYLTSIRIASLADSEQRDAAIRLLLIQIKSYYPERLPAEISKLTKELMAHLPQPQQAKPTKSSRNRPSWVAAILLFFVLLNFAEFSPRDKSIGLIEELASAYGLTEMTGINSHLSFRDMEVVFWENAFESGLTAEGLGKQFAAYQEVITQAEDDGREILSRDDLSLLATEQISINAEY